MNPCAIIREATEHNVELLVHAGRLYLESSHGPPPAALLAAIKAHKPDIIAALHVLATSADLFTTTRASCPPASTLTSAARAEAEHLAADLTARGGNGQFVCDLFHAWNALTTTDRSTAVLAWQLAAGHDAAEPLEEVA